MQAHCCIVQPQGRAFDRRLSFWEHIKLIFICAKRGTGKYLWAKARLPKWQCCRRLVLRLFLELETGVEAGIPKLFQDKLEKAHTFCTSLHT